ncbi:Cyclic nucleotide-binding protein [Pseudocohnilembus persalinus]|uniref:Cyclic nucleotide-binding protein n=1 Tax=Pseudocohnilembus persalinus TaxID=266149 RepID=A0A0V0QR78_PSEPJ|nr:Cyclic nucleotide-binding protein [Pseudocohnilembus persalinus]|eukprot:KRX04716.1 Cyclic nucleotide-binding protein [Pseudocohnilembus persalinus]
MDQHQNQWGNQNLNQNENQNQNQNKSKNQSQRQFRKGSGNFSPILENSPKKRTNFDKKGSIQFQEDPIKEISQKIPKERNKRDIYTLSLQILQFNRENGVFGVGGGAVFGGGKLSVLVVVFCVFGGVDADLEKRRSGFAEGGQRSGEFQLGKQVLFEAVFRIEICVWRVGQGSADQIKINKDRRKSIFIKGSTNFQDDKNFEELFQNFQLEKTREQKKKQQQKNSQNENQEGEISRPLSVIQEIAMSIFQQENEQRNHLQQQNLKEAFLSKKHCSQEIIQEYQSSIVQEREKFLRENFENWRNQRAKFYQDSNEFFSNQNLNQNQENILEEGQNDANRYMMGEPAVRKCKKEIENCFMGQIDLWKIYNAEQLFDNQVFLYKNLGNQGGENNNNNQNGNNNNNKNQNNNNKNQTNEKSNMIQQGDVYGITELQLSIPHKESVLAVKPCLIGILTLQDYQDILAAIDQIRLYKKVNVLAQQFGEMKFDNWQKILGRLIPYRQKIFLQKNQYVYKENEEISGVYFLKKGEFMLKKSVELQPRPNFQEGKIQTVNPHRDLAQQGTQLEKNKNQEENEKKTGKILAQNSSNTLCQVQLSYINSGSFQGEYEILQGIDKRIYSIQVVSANAKVYFIEKNVFLREIRYSNQVDMENILKVKQNERMKYYMEQFNKIEKVIQKDDQKRLTQVFLNMKLTDRNLKLGESISDYLEKQLKNKKYFKKQRDTFEKFSDVTLQKQQLKQQDILTSSRDKIGTAQLFNVKKQLDNEKNQRYLQSHLNNLEILQSRQQGQICDQNQAKGKIRSITQGNSFGQDFDENKKKNQIQNQNQNQQFSQKKQKFKNQNNVIQENQNESFISQGEDKNLIKFIRSKSNNLHVSEQEGKKQLLKKSQKNIFMTPVKEKEGTKFQETDFGFQNKKNGNIIEELSEEQKYLLEREFFYKLIQSELKAENIDTHKLMALQAYFLKRNSTKKKKKKSQLDLLYKLGMPVQKIESIEDIQSKMSHYNLIEKKHYKQNRLFQKRLNEFQKTMSQIEIFTKQGKIISKEKVSTFTNLNKQIEKKQDFAFQILMQRAKNEVAKNQEVKMQFQGLDQLEMPMQTKPYSREIVDLEFLEKKKQKIEEAKKKRDMLIQTPGNCYQSGSEFLTDLRLEEIQDYENFIASLQNKQINQKDQKNQKSQENQKNQENYENQKNQDFNLMGSFNQNFNLDLKNSEKKRELEREFRRVNLVGLRNQNGQEKKINIEDLLKDEHFQTIQNQEKNQDIQESKTDQFYKVNSLLDKNDENLGASQNQNWNLSQNQNQKMSQKKEQDSQESKKTSVKQGVYKKSIFNDSPKLPKISQIQEKNINNGKQEQIEKEKQNKIQNNNNNQSFNKFNQNFIKEEYLQQFYQEYQQEFQKYKTEFQEYQQEFQKYLGEKGNQVEISELSENFQDFQNQKLQSIQENQIEEYGFEENQNQNLNQNADFINGQLSPCLGNQFRPKIKIRNQRSHTEQKLKKVSANLFSETKKQFFNQNQISQFQEIGTEFDYKHFPQIQKYQKNYSQNNLKGLKKSALIFNNNINNISNLDNQNEQNNRIQQEKEKLLQNLKDLKKSQSRITYNQAHSLMHNQVKMGLEKQPKQMFFDKLKIANNSHSVITLTNHMGKPTRYMISEQIRKKDLKF